MFYVSNAQDTDIEIKQFNMEVSNLTKEVIKLKDKENKMQTSLNELKSIQKNYINRISFLEKENDSIKKTIDSIIYNYSILLNSQQNDKELFISQIDDTKEKIKSNQDLLSIRTNIGSILLVIILMIITIVILIFFKKYKNGANTIGEVRKSQKALQTAQSKMQEDSVKLDNQMLALIERQINVSSTKASTETDHSLALKVADEIVRIEVNLSRMDTSVKGYKQLAKAVERIKNNFQANGYEIIDMLGKPYNEGMKVVANFVPDETLKEGEQFITGVTKPQINYNGKMIQSAQITVSQNI